MYLTDLDAMQRRRRYDLCRVRHQRLEISSFEAVMPTSDHYYDPLSGFAGTILLTPFEEVTKRVVDPCSVLRGKASD